MKAISIKQPWLHFIAEGWKTLEIRTWRTNYRGPLVLVASAQIDRHWISAATAEAYRSIRYGDLLYGQAICTAELVDCRPMVKADEEAAMCYWSPPIVKTGGSVLMGHKARYEQLYAWQFKNVQKINPFPVKGRLSFYDVEMPGSDGIIPLTMEE